MIPLWGRLARRIGLAARPSPVRVVFGDIARRRADVLVNAVDRTLRAGSRSGVDGRLRQAAGPELARALERMDPLEPCRCVATPGFGLDCSHVIHVVVPGWNGHPTPLAWLSACYDSVLDLASELGAVSVVFPLLGGGSAGWPREDACDAACSSLERRTGSRPEVSFATADAEDFTALVNALERDGLLGDAVPPSVGALPA